MVVPELHHFITVGDLVLDSPEQDKSNKGHVRGSWICIWSFHGISLTKIEISEHKFRADSDETNSIPITGHFLKQKKMAKAQVTFGLFYS